MDIHTILAIVFMLGMGAFLYIRRSSLTFHKILGPIVYFAMYRASWGLKWMDGLASRFPRFLRWLFFIGIIIGFLGMALISFEIVRSTIQLFAQPGLPPAIQPVLPIQAKNVFFVPFTYWILSIFVIAAIHEFAHGVAARVHKVPVKSSGFAFLGIIAPIIPAAFVEPDEKVLSKRPASQQLSVFAAGPLANILLAFAIIIFFGFPLPGVPTGVTNALSVVDLPGIAGTLTETTAMRITSVTPGTPAATAGLGADMSISAIDEVPVSDTDALTKHLATFKPKQDITMTVDGNEVPLTLVSRPDDASRALIGIQFTPVTGITQGAISKYGETGTELILAAMTLVIFIYALSLGVGLFNLLPLGPLDGGRMFRLASIHLFGEQRGHSAWKYLGIFFFGIIILNLTIGFVR